MYRILTALLVGGVSLQAWAADVKGTEDAVYVVPLKKKYRLESKGSKLHEMKRSIMLEPGEDVTLYVDEINPILYQYDGTKLPPVDTENFVAAIKFAEVMKKFGLNKLPAGVQLQADGAIYITIADIDVAKLDRSVRALSYYIAEIPNIIDQSITKDSIESAKATVNKWTEIESIKKAILDAKAKLDNVASLKPEAMIEVAYTTGNTTQKLNVPVGCVVHGQLNLENLADIIRQVSLRERKREANWRSAEAKNKLTVQGDDVSNSKDIDQADRVLIQEAINTASTNLLTEPFSVESACEKIAILKSKYEAKPAIVKLLNNVCSSLRVWAEAASRAAATEKISEVEAGKENLACPDVAKEFDLSADSLIWTESVSTFNILFARRNDFDKMVSAAESLIQFKGLIQQVGSQKELARVSYDAKRVQPIKITVSPNSAFATSFNKEAREAQAGGIFEGIINFEPKENFHLKVTPAVVYSFVEVSKFSAVKKEAGKFVIQETETAYAALNVAAMMNIYPDKYFGGRLEPFLQIGLTPNPDEWAFFLGAGMEIYDGMTIATGVVYQQVEELADGLKVGMGVVDQTSIKTKDEFDTGLYIQLGVRF